MSEPPILDGDTPLALSVEQAVQYGASSVVTFGNIFLPRAFKQKSPDFHFELADLLAGPNRYNAFSVFRGGAKTTLLRTFTLQRICYALSNTIMFVSATQDHSILSINWLKGQIERNKRIQEAFGLRPGKKWAETYIEIISDVMADPISVIAVGITGQIRGFNIDDARPDLIIADDIQTEESVGTETQQEKTHELFFAALINSLAPATENPVAKAVLLQTPMRRGDIISTCLEDPLWVGKKFSVFDDKGLSIWEDRYPTQWLRIEKAAFIRRGKYSLWMSEWECTIVKSEYKTFDIRNLQYWKDLPTKNSGCVTAIDPASSEDKKASDNVVLTAMRNGPDIYVAAYVAAKGQMPDKVVNDFFTHKFAFQPGKLLIETVAYQKILKWFFDQEMLKRRVFVPIKEIKDKRPKSDRIIQALAGLVSHKHLFVHESMFELIQQFDQFEPDKNGRYDIIDALATAVDELASPFASGAYIELPVEDLMKEERRTYGELQFDGGAP